MSEEWGSGKECSCQHHKSTGKINTIGGRSLKRPSVEANEGLIQQASVQAVNHPIAQVTKYRQVSTGAIIGASSSETTARSSKATSKRVQISERPSRRPYIQFSKLLRIRPSGLYTDINDINEAGKTSWQAEVSTRVSQQTNLQSSQERSKRAGVSLGATKHQMVRGATYRRERASERSKKSAPGQSVYSKQEASKQAEA